MIKHFISNVSAWKESIIDTCLALLINLPLNMLLLYCCKLLELSVIQTSVTLSFVFTVVAIIRKYCLRVLFSR